MRLQPGYRRRPLTHRPARTPPGRSYLFAYTPVTLRPLVLLGGEPRPLQAYDSYGIIDPTEDAQLLQRPVQSGFRAIKIKIGGGSLAEDVRIVQATRRIIGPDVTLMVDYNQSLRSRTPLRASACSPSTTWPGSRSRCPRTTCTATGACAPV